MWRWVVLTLFFLFCWQVFWWRYDAFSVARLQIKEVTSGLDNSDRIRWIRICRAQENHECVADIFAQWLLAEPDNAWVSGQLAVAWAKMNLCSKAMDQFDQHEDVNDLGAEGMYWRGRCAESSNRFEEARSYYYASLALNSEQNPAAEFLFRLLWTSRNESEALSLAASLSEGKPARDSYWRNIFAEFIHRPAQPHAVQPLSIRIPSADGVKFWVPVWVGPGGVVEFVLLDRESAATQLSKALLVGSRGLASDSAVGVVKKMPALKLGPWLLPEVAYEICENCVSTIGFELLDRFEISEEIVAGTRFIQLSPK